MTAHERRRLLEDFFGACNDSEIRWVLLRGKVTLETPGKDVDLLVDRAHQPLFEEVVRWFGGVVPPGRLHPSHRTYRLGRPLADAIPLDVVTRIAYSRSLQIVSGLESGCLDRRVREGWLFELDPTDLFWTVLLHCLLDKRRFTERRVAELRATVSSLTRPSDGERFASGLLPPDWSTDRLVESVAQDDVEGLEALAAQLTSAPDASAVRRNPRWGLDATAGKVYNRLWLASGLGAPVRADDVLDAAQVSSVVTGVRHRPGLVDVTVAVPKDRIPEATGALAAAGYRQWAGRWSRIRGKALENVRLSTAPWGGPGPSSTVPLGGRQHCRWAVPDGRSSGQNPGPDQEPVEGAT